MTPAAQDRSTGSTSSAPTMHVRAARLVHDGGAEPVVLVAEDLQPVGDAAAAEVRAAGDDHAGGFAAGVGINDGNFFHGKLSCLNPARTVVRTAGSAADGRAHQYVHFRFGTFGRLAMPSWMIFKTRLRSSPVERQARRAHPFAAQPAFLHRQLDVLHELRAVSRCSNGVNQR